MIKKVEEVESESKLSINNQSSKIQEDFSEDLVAFIL